MEASVGVAGNSDGFGAGEEVRDRIRVKRGALDDVLEKFHRTLELLSHSDGVDDDDGGGEGPDSRCRGQEADHLHDLIKSRVECSDLLEKLVNTHVAVPFNSTEEGNSWDMVTGNDLWVDENIDSYKEEYVLVKQEDIIEGIASFIAAYLLSLKQTKELSPNQLQDALNKTFSLTRKKGKLQKAWDGS